MNAYSFFREVLQKLKTKFSSGEAENITAMMFEKIAGISKTDLIKVKNLEINQPTIKQLEESVDKLFLDVPIQYILGEAWFYGNKFLVNPSVLIPRPETEELVELVLKELKSDANKSILDIGSGSGCIPITIKKKFNQAKVTSVDISEDALEIAKQNATIIGTFINFQKLDFLERENWQLLGAFDIIVSNPPYIPFSEKESLDKNVRDYEPETALFVDEPLIFYRAIADFSTTNLLKEGKIFMEVHENFSHSVSEHFVQKGFITNVLKDIYGKDRFVVAQFPKV
ncbi:MAG: peptide chain release factor N(5)-glutamine methyltransferase [Bacteroidetes bacterium]|nr:peptide chain release factor N(5)-glutamine methyltransferase [Bacteroidota bacterium]